MGGWRDTVVSGALMGPAMFSQMDVAAMADASGAQTPLERSAAVVLDDTSEAVGEYVKGRSEGEEAGSAEKLAEAEYGDLPEVDGMNEPDDEGFEFESVDGVDSTENSDVAEDGSDDGDATDGGWI